MATEGYSPIIVESLGGRCTVIPRAALPLGKSPDCQDVKFTPGSVSTRDGLTAAYVLPYAVTNSLSSFVANSGAQTLLLQDATGAIYKSDETSTTSGSFSPPVGTVPLTPVAVVLSDQGGTMMKGCTLFNKHWMCVSDGKKGLAQPFYYDGDGSGAYAAGVEGPARAPTVAAVSDMNGILPENVDGVYAWLDPVLYTAMPAAGIVTVTMGGPRGTQDIVVGATTYKIAHALAVDQVAPAYYFGGMNLYTAVSKDDATASVTFNKAWSNTGPGTGYAQALDDVLVITPPYTRGRTVRYAWLMKSGYISQLSPPGRAPTHVGRCRYDYSDLAKGPPGTVARLIFVGVQIGAEMFHVESAMTLADNTNTSLTGQTFTDDELMAGMSYVPYQRLMSLGPYAGVCSYKERLVFWRGVGETYQRVEDLGIPNASFNGGSLMGMLSYLEPMGWSGRSSGADRGYTYVMDPVAGTTNGTSLRFVGGGASGTSQWFSSEVAVTKVSAAKKVGVRVRVKRQTLATAGSYLAFMVEAKVGASYTTVATNQVNITSLATANIYETKEFDGTVTVPTGTTALRLNLHAYYATSAADEFWVDSISLYEVGSRADVLGRVAITRAGDPESLDADTGFIMAGPDDGQDLGCCFELRGNLYMAKRNSLYVSQDNGQEPLFWDVQQVSSTCGTPSLYGVGKGDGWAIIAGPNGAYLFDGSVPSLLSYDILPDWQKINWAVGEKVWVLVDAERKVVYIGAPINGATDCNMIFVMDYSRGLDTDSRQWTLWNRGVRAGAIMPATEEKSRVLFACYTAVAPGAVVKIDDTSTVDFDGLIPAYYMTAPFGAQIGRSSWEKFVLRVMGNGTLPVSIIRPDGTAVPLQAATLSTSPVNDPEFGTGAQDTQLSLRIGDPAAPVTNWFVTKIASFIKNATYGWLRGQR